MRKIKITPLKWGHVRSRRDQSLVSDGGAVFSWLVRLTPDRAVWLRALTGDIVLFSWMDRTLCSHSASLHPGVQMGTSELILGVTLRRTSISSSGELVQILLVALCYKRWDKLRPDWALGSYADVMFLLCQRKMSKLIFFNWRFVFDVILQVCRTGSPAALLLHQP